MRAMPLDVGRDLPSDHLLPTAEVKKNLLENTDTITWLGHCAFLIKVAGITILTDTFLEGCAGSSLLRGLRRIPSPLLPEDIPPIDILLLSHGHYDHFLDSNIQRLSSKSAARCIVPLKLGDRLRSCGFQHITELDWFKEEKINSTVITAMPAIHYSDPFFNRTLWCGYKIDFGNGVSIYFAGDSGYGSTFARDIRPYGPFSLALVGIGSLTVSGYKRAKGHKVHSNPEEAVQIAIDTQAQNLIGMHWGTVRMGDEDQLELPKRLVVAAKEKEYPGSVSLMRIGETRPLIF